MQENIPVDLLPEEELQAETMYNLPELHYPRHVNAAVEAVDKHVSDGHEDAVAIYFEGNEITYGELQSQVNKLGNVLQNLGVEPGDRVFTRFPNRPEYVVTCLATQKIGAVTLPSMKLLQAEEISYVLEDARPTAAVVYDELLPELEEAMQETDRSPETTIVYDEEEIDHKHHSYQQQIDTAAETLEPYNTHRDDAVMLAYTSGTTGQPKGTLHTHREMLAISDGYARYCLDPSPDDVFCSNAPIAFTFGYGLEVSMPLHFGASTVLLQDSKPMDLVRATEQYDISIIASIPTAYNQILDNREQVEQFDLSSLRTGVSAGEPMPTSTFEGVKKVMGIELTDGIGCTELLHIFISHRHDQEIDPTATGYPVPGYECRVVDPETDEEVERGTEGLLQVRGPTGKTYWNRPEKQKENVSDGWSMPGDIYIHREDGRFEYVSRQDNLIITGGYNVPGPQVEDTLQMRSEVQESAVVGIPDEERGKIVKAFVLLTDGVAPSEELVTTLQDHVKNEIAPYKYPREIEFISEFPKTETGKIKRNVLRESEESE
jgi:2-aminobenzoate-CoA ligase